MRHQVRYLSAASQKSYRNPTRHVSIPAQLESNAQHPTCIEANKEAFVPAAEEALRKAITKIAGTALVGHEGAVYGVAFSPDGQRAGDGEC